MNARLEVDPAEELRSFYEMRLRVAEAARSDLLKALGEGLPRLTALPGGGYDGLAGLRHARISRLVNAYVTACKALDHAATAVVEAMDWDEDEAMDNGIKWEVSL